MVWAWSQPQARNSDGPAVGPSYARVHAMNQQSAY